MPNAPRDTLAELHGNLTDLIAESKIASIFIKRIIPETLQNGALTGQLKELIALGIAVATRCDYCIVLHVKKCYEMGITRAELVEVLGVAILMGGGPALTYASYAMEAIQAFEPHPEDDDE